MRVDPEILDFLSYDPGTGLFRWIKSPAQNVKADTVAGCVRKDGYRVIQFAGRSYYAHRLAWWFVTGVWPPLGLDHRDRDHDHNAIGNLRLATESQNAANTAAPRTNTSGFKGVFFDKRAGRWIATLGIGGRRKRLGRFDTPEAAALAYDLAAHEHFGEFARLNFSTGEQLQTVIKGRTAVEAARSIA